MQSELMYSTVNKGASSIDKSYVIFTNERSWTAQLATEIHPTP